MFKRLNQYRSGPEKGEGYSRFRFLDRIWDFVWIFFPGSIIMCLVLATVWNWTGTCHFAWYLPHFGMFTPDDS